MPMNQEDIERHIVRAITELLGQKGAGSDGLTADSPIDQRLGLDSLDWAAFIVRLEDELGVDPFRQPTGELWTVGDLVRVYQGALSGK